VCGADDPAHGKAKGREAELAFCRGLARSLLGLGCLSSRHLVFPDIGRPRYVLNPLPCEAFERMTVPDSEPHQIVDRERELETIGERLASAEHGLQAIVVEGEPGIGKTTLWEAVVGQASAQGYRMKCINTSGKTQSISCAGVGKRVQGAVR
jgi:hypothetical protein